MKKKEVHTIKGNKHHKKGKKIMKGREKNERGKKKKKNNNKKKDKPQILQIETDAAKERDISLVPGKE